MLVNSVVNELIKFKAQSNGKYNACVLLIPFILSFAILNALLTSDLCVYKEGYNGRSQIQSQSNSEIRNAKSEVHEDEVRGKELRTKFNKGHIITASSTMLTNSTDINTLDKYQQRKKQHALQQRLATALQIRTKALIRKPGQH